MLEIIHISVIITGAWAPVPTGAPSQARRYIRPRLAGAHNAPVHPTGEQRKLSERASGPVPQLRKRTPRHPGRAGMAPTPRRQLARQTRSDPPAPQEPFSSSRTSPQGYRRLQAGPYGHSAQISTSVAYAPCTKVPAAAPLSKDAPSALMYVMSSSWMCPVTVISAGLLSTDPASGLRQPSRPALPGRDNRSVVAAHPQ